MKFYTDAISKELLDTLISRGYPENGTTVPTYADVLDWMINKGINISIGHVKDTENWFALTDKSGTFTRHYSFKETLEKVILLGLDFIKTD